MTNCEHHKLYLLFNEEGEYMPCIRCHNEYEGIFYHCVGCDVSFDLECIPLPCVVSHECHTHPLALAYLTDGDSSKYCSNVCEICKKQWMAPELVFYCHKCTCFVHVECAVSKETKKSQIRHHNHEIETPTERQARTDPNLRDDRERTVMRR